MTRRHLWSDYILAPLAPTSPNILPKAPQASSPPYCVQTVPFAGKADPLSFLPAFHNSFSKTSIVLVDCFAAAWILGHFLWKPALNHPCKSKECLLLYTKQCPQHLSQDTSITVPDSLCKNIVGDHQVSGEKGLVWLKYQIFIYSLGYQYLTY